MFNNLLVPAVSTETITHLRLESCLRQQKFCMICYKTLYKEAQEEHFRATEDYPVGPPPPLYFPETEYSLQELCYTVTYDTKPQTKSLEQGPS
jgi:hypothetical protein